MRISFPVGSQSSSRLVWSVFVCVVVYWGRKRLKRVWKREKVCDWTSTQHVGTHAQHKARWRKINQNKYSVKTNMESSRTKHHLLNKMSTSKNWDAKINCWKKNSTPYKKMRRWNLPKPQQRRAEPEPKPWARPAMTSPPRRRSPEVEVQVAATPVRATRDPTSIGNGITELLELLEIFHVSTTLIAIPTDMETDMKTNTWQICCTGTRITSDKGILTGLQDHEPSRTTTSTEFSKWTPCTITTTRDVGDHGPGPWKATLYLQVQLSLSSDRPPWDPPSGTRIFRRGSTPGVRAFRSVLVLCGICVSVWRFPCIVVMGGCHVEPSDGLVSYQTLWGNMSGWNLRRRRVVMMDTWMEFDILSVRKSVEFSSSSLKLLWRGDDEVMWVGQHFSS